MKRALTAVIASALVLLALAPGAPAAFGIKELEIEFTKADGTPATQAGLHPHAMRTFLTANTVTIPEGEAPDGAVKTLKLELPEGFIGNQSAVPRCSTLDFLTLAPEGNRVPSCQNGSAIGTARVMIGEKGGPVDFDTPVYWVAPPPGSIAKLGFWIEGVPVTVDIGLSQSAPYRVQVISTNISQVLEFFGVETILWGNPADPVHDTKRGACLIKGGSCPAGIEEIPFLTLPRSCEGDLKTRYEVDSWQEPGQWVTGEATTPGMGGCPKVGFGPQITSQPTNRQAESPSGLDFEVSIEDEELTNPTGIADSDIKRAEVLLPEGMTINPSQAEGLQTCSQADLARETATSEFGQGCPPASKVGTLEVESPLLEGVTLRGHLFVATPYENPTGSLIAVYMVIQDPVLGISVKLPVKVTPDPRNGRLIATTQELPQLPISRFHLHFREGGRSPLVTPPACGTYSTLARFTPWANPAQTYQTSSSFQVTSGVNGGPCPPGGVPPFSPGFSAGTVSNSAGSFSPFEMRITRPDAHQDLTRFSATLPPGLVAKLAGTSACPDAAIAAAKARPGRAELASPSCPASSRIGSVLAGAGVGSELTYVPGSVYLAGPYNGAPLSVVGIVPAVAGPFDVGTVVTRQALVVDRRTAEVRVDGDRSDPIPHILAGIPLKVRDIRVSVDRPQFTLNPTSCDPSAVAATLWGGGTNVFSIADDSPVLASDRFQAANCAALGFKPKLSLKLKGGTKRGGHPALTGTYRPRPGDANLSGLVLRLPRSAFLDQGHIRTICTRVQFAANACPAGAVYGHAVARTPLLSDPLAGPVYLRSSDNDLPDLVADLRGLIDVEAVARIDSLKGGIRATFEDVPDAPLTEVVVRMQGGKKGLIENSANLCGAKRRANASLGAHNAKRHRARPVLVASGCKGKKRKRQGKQRNSGR